MKYKRFVTIIFILVTFLIAACSGSEEAPLTVPADAQAGDLVVFAVGLILRRAK